MTFQGIIDRLGLPTFRGYAGLVTALAVDSLGSGLFLPFSVVYFLHTTDLSVAIIGASLTMARLLAIPTSVVAGPLIDRFDARRVLAVGNLVSAVAFGGYLIVDTAWQLVIASLLVSIGQATFWTASRALVGEAVAPESRPSWFAMQTMTRNAGYGLGGLVAAVAVGLEDDWIYLVLAGGNAVSFLFAGLLVLRWREPTIEFESAMEAQEAEPGGGGYRQLLRDRGLLLVTGVNLAFVMCANVLNVLLVVYVTTALHQPAWIGGALFTVNTVLVSTTQTVVTRSVGGFRKLRVLEVATLCWAASFTVLWTMSVVPGWVAVLGLFAAIIMFTAAEMLQDPIINTLVVGIAPKHLVGRYVAAFQLSWSVGNAIAPALLTPLLEAGDGLPWMAMLAICAVAVVGIRRIGRFVPAPLS